MKEDRMPDVEALYATTDATVWGEALAEVIANGAIPDAGLFVGWFANYRQAIELQQKQQP